MVISRPCYSLPHEAGSAVWNSPPTSTHRVVTPQPLEMARGYHLLFWKRYGRKRMRMVCRRRLMLYIVTHHFAHWSLSIPYLVYKKGNAVDQREKREVLLRSHCTMSILGRYWISPCDIITLLLCLDLKTNQPIAVTLEGWIQPPPFSHSVAATPVKPVVCPSALSVVWQTKCKFNSTTPPHTVCMKYILESAAHWKEVINQKSPLQSIFLLPKCHSKTFF